MFVDARTDEEGNLDAPAGDVVGIPDDGPPLVRFRVRCGGELHWVVYRPGGWLSFPDHTRASLRRELAGQRTAGQQDCRCAQVLLAWRESIKQGQGNSWLPRALSAAARAAGAVSSSRQRSGTAFGKATWVPQWHERTRFLARLLTRLLRRRFALLPRVTCRVRDFRGSGKLAPTSYVLRVVSGGVTLLASWLPRRWFAEVYREGLAFHRGCLVLEKSPPTHQKGPHADWVLARCWPYQAPDGTLKIAEDRVGVARQADGTFLVVRGPAGEHLH